MHFSGCLLTTYYLNVRINLDALALLPEDGNLTGLHSVTLDSTIDDPEPLSAQGEDPYNAHFSGSLLHPQHHSDRGRLIVLLNLFTLELFLRFNMVVIHQYYQCSSITSTETQRVYRHVRSGSPPQCPAFV